MCEAFARRDWPSALAPLDPDIEWDMSTYEAWLDPRVTRGTEAVQEFFRSFLGTWDDYEIEFEEFIDAGDEVLVLVRDRGRGKGSGAPVERTWAQLWTVRDGKVVRFRPYADRETALAMVAT
jgi:ketosteroid isomerase-like protein